MQTQMRVMHGQISNPEVSLPAASIGRIGWGPATSFISLNTIGGKPTTLNMKEDQDTYAADKRVELLAPS